MFTSMLWVRQLKQIVVIKAIQAFRNAYIAFTLKKKSWFQSLTREKLFINLVPCGQTTQHTATRRYRGRQKLFNYVIILL